MSVAVARRVWDEIRETSARGEAIKAKRLGRDAHFSMDHGAATV